MNKHKLTIIYTYVYLFQQLNVVCKKLIIFNCNTRWILNYTLHAVCFTIRNWGKYLISDIMHIVKLACQGCTRSSKVSVHVRIHVRLLKYKSDIFCSALHSCIIEMIQSFITYLVKKNH